MGLALPYFYTLTPREFQNHVTGFRKAQEWEYRNGWEKTRRIMWAVLLPHQKKGAQLAPQKVMGFGWDKEEAPQLEGEADPAELEAAKLRWEEIDRKRAERDAKGEAPEKKKL